MNSPSISDPVTDRDNPWPGLASFTEETRALFHGRDEEIGELSRRVQRKLLTILFGQSGHGKTSILRAGVVPRLRNEGYCPIYVRIDYGREAAPPSAQIQQAIARTVEHSPAAVAGESLWEFLHHRDAPLRDATGRALIPLVIFDQFEEIFTLGQADDSARERAAAFMEELADLVENRAPRAVEAKLEQDDTILDRFDFGRSDYRILISLREDYLPHLETLRGRMPSITQNRMRLAQMTGTQALDAVQKPGGSLVTPEVARAIVEFVSGARGGSIERLAELSVEPPLLSVICRELNERRRALGQAQITADLVTGNRREILTDFYERSVADLPEAMRRFVEDKLLTKSGFRDNLALETALEEPGVTKPLIDTLVSRRLLRLEDRIGAQRVELTHDVLADVVRASRDARQQRLAMAVASRAAKRQRFVISGLATAVVALLVGAFFGIRAQRRAEKLARAEAAQASQTDVVLASRLLDEGKLSEGLAYLVRAGHKDPANPIVAPRLLTALTARNFMLPVGPPLELPSPATGGVFLADGRRVLLQGEDGTVRLVDADAWKVAREYSFAAKVALGGVAVAEKNGDVFAVVLEDNRIAVVETASGQLRFPLIQPAGKIAGRTPQFSLSADGHWLAAVGPAEIWVWNATNGTLETTIDNKYIYRAYDLSPDGKRIATIHTSGIARIWALPGGAAIGEPIETSPNVWSARFSASGNRVLIGNREGFLVCDAQTGSPVRPIIPISTYGLNDGWLTPDGSRIVYTGTDRTVTVLDVASGKPVLPPLVHGGNVLEGTLVADGKVLFTNSVDGLFRLWDLEKGMLLAEPTLIQQQYTPAAVSRDGKTVVMFSTRGPAYRLRTSAGAVRPLALPRSPDTTLSVNFGAGSPTTLMWVKHAGVETIDVGSGGKASGGFRFPEPITSFSRSPYGSTLGAGDVVSVTVIRKSGGSRLWTLGDNGVANDCELEGVPRATSTWVDPRLQRIAFSGVANDGQRVIAIWDTKTGRRLTDIPSPGGIRGNNYGCAFSSDGRLIAFQTNDDLVYHVCEIETRKELFKLQLTGRAALSVLRFSPDGTKILTGDTWGAVHVWDVAMGKMLRSTQRHRTSVTRFDHSSPGRYYASLSTDGSVQVWDAATDEPVGALMEQSGAAGRADFGPDNSRIITPSNRGSARVWDVRTGLPLTDPLLADEEPVMVVAFSPDGKFVEAHAFATTPKQSIRVWPAPPASAGPTPRWLLNLATICAGHRLTDSGKLVMASEELAEIEEIERDLSRAPANDPYAEWARWFLSDKPTRPIAPGFTITPADAEKVRLEFLAATKPPAAAGN